MLAPILATLVFVGFFVLVYRQLRGFYPSSTIVEDPTATMPNVPGEDEAHLLFFYTTWCPHSKTAIPEWNSLKETAEKKTYGGRHMRFRALDGDSAKTALARYGVDAFPSVVLVTQESIVHYEGRVRAQGIHRWLLQTLGPEADELGSA